MKNKILWLVPALVVVVATQGPSRVVAQDECVTVEIPTACQGGGRLTLNANSLNVSPPNLCATPGSRIEVNVVPQGFASIQPKGGGTWPRGSGETFTLDVPEEPGTYDYAVYFENGSCIDPRISVD